MMHKTILYALIIILTNFTEQDFVKNEVSLKDITAFIEDSSSLKLLTNRKAIFIDDTLGTNKINIPVYYRYPHKDWTFILGYTLFYELSSKGYSKILANNSENKFYLSVIYNMDKPNKEALNACYIPGDFSIFKNHKMYYQYSKYVIQNMSPSDFQAYDWALSTLYNKYKDERFNITFFDFFYKLSKDSILEPDEKFILEHLIKWTEERGEIETPKHFVYFLNSLKGLDSECEVDLKK